METKLYNQEGKEIGTVELNQGIFGLPMNADLLHQARVAISANSRTPVAHTKDRAEVRGGGRKPWRQKGTGRARHGSRRSPIWKGGGVSHGPRKEKDYSQKINKKMAKLAFKTALSSKFKAGKVAIVNDVAVVDSKTKSFALLAKKLMSIFERHGKVLLVLPKAEKNLTLASRNLISFRITTVEQLSVLDILNAGGIILTKGALEKVK